MLRIRFHGRGGHGVKTASRILGTAGFLAGLYAQDAPIYGAERRGAAVSAFAWLSREPIRERGLIARPDVLAIADETLLDDEAAGVLAGATSTTRIVVNTDRDDCPPSLIAFLPRVHPIDITSAARATLGRAQALSAGLAAVVARVTQLISIESLVQALHEELRSMGVSEEQRRQNERLARELYGRIDVASEEVDATAGAVSTAAIESLRPPAVNELATISYDGPVYGAPSILATGNSSARHTGAWRVDRPVVDGERCTRCGLCLVQCPDGVIALDDHGYPVIDYDHCKGCMICGQVCPVKAIHEKRETRAW